MEFKSIPVDIEKIKTQTAECLTPEDSIVLGALSLDMALGFLKRLSIGGSFPDGRTWKFEVSALIALDRAGAEK